MDKNFHKNFRKKKKNKTKLYVKLKEIPTRKFKKFLF